MKQGFLPVSREDLRERGIEQLDFVYVIGDAYVDHPSFGPAIISRLLEAKGYTVGIIAQPDWKDKNSVCILGEPRLAFLVSSGNMDSMVNHYSVSKKHRKTDAYSPGGQMGCRPDRAVIVYGNLIRQSYKKIPVIIGGIEASLRRLAHYDYWSDRVRRSVLLDSGADLISYGMGEHSIAEIADALNSGISIGDITYIPGTVYRSKTTDQVFDGIFLPSYEEMCADKKAYAKSFMLQYENADAFAGKTLIEPYENQGFVIQNPPAKPLSTQEFDDIYEHPYQYTAHPMYADQGEIPAISEIKFSLTSNRGCFGACNFCALTFHQGRIVQTRSHASLLKEARQMTEDPEFKGYIHDVGGPTADFRHPSCEKQLTKGTCKDKQCLFPVPCKNLRVDHRDYQELLTKLRKLPKVKKVFVRSGIRFDYVMADKNRGFLEDLVKYHVSGQLRVAPEHVSSAVLSCMGKPEHEVYQSFLKAFALANKKAGLEQYAVPYFMSSHPGCTMKEAVKLAEYVRDMDFMPEQVQDFYPTPATISTCMYYTGLDPRTMKPVYVPRNPHEKAMQRALIQYRLPANRELVREALVLSGRKDLIGYDRKCLIRPQRGETAGRDPSTKRTKKRKAIRNVHKKKG
ncbi:MAG: YgiQ family radical SAM protein [Lachnospiraceae bacterium]|jgi:uncharacterized radical SAM protein YgiQ